MTIRKKEDYTAEQWQKILHERARNRRNKARQRARDPEQNKKDTYKGQAKTFMRHHANDSEVIELLDTYINESKKQKNIINELKNWIKKN